MHYDILFAHGELETDTWRNLTCPRSQGMSVTEQRFESGQSDQRLSS